MASQAIDHLGDYSERNQPVKATLTERLVSRVSRWSGVVLLAVAVLSLGWFLLI